jgi:hypothetical protein
MGDIMGVEVNHVTRYISFTKNKELLDLTYRNSTTTLYPTIGFVRRRNTSKSNVEVNFKQPYIFMHKIIIISN